MSGAWVQVVVYISRTCLSNPVSPPVGFYRKFVLPRLINLSMRNAEVMRIRSQIIPFAEGRVLEVGIGSGLNLPFYSSDVLQLQGLDPSLELLRMTGKKSGSVSFPLDLISATAEQIPVADGAIDTVVVTWALCSIPEPDKALAEIRRVLKLGGELIFAEHGLAPDPKVRARQNRFNAPWKVIAGGCNLNRPVEQLISSAGFSMVKLETTYLSGPRMLTFTYKGCAQKR
jgi:SAM-dependent methyltransferase